MIKLFWTGSVVDKSFPQARNLRREELQDHKVMDAVARKCAYVHTLDVPIVKEPTWMWDTLSKWAHRLLKQSCADLDMVIDFPAEVTWLRFISLHLSQACLHAEW